MNSKIIFNDSQYCMDNQSGLKSFDCPQTTDVNDTVVVNIHYNLGTAQMDTPIILNTSDVLGRLRCMRKALTLKIRLWSWNQSSLVYESQNILSFNNYLLN